MDECHLIYTQFMNSKSLSPLPAFAWGDHAGTLPLSNPPFTQNSKFFSILNYVSSSAVGWRRPISRLGGAPERHPDVMAPHHRQALPNTAVWVLQPRHPGGSSWGSAEPSCWQLEGKDCVYVPVILKDICTRYWNSSGCQSVLKVRNLSKQQNNNPNSRHNLVVCAVG